MRNVILLTSAFCVSSCANLDPGKQNPRSYQVITISGGLEISENGQPITRIKTELPNVEDWKFIESNQFVITKSRGNHGPAQVEKFETRTGILRDKVFAYAIRDKQVKWAKGFEE